MFNKIVISDVVFEEVDYAAEDGAAFDMAVAEDAQLYATEADVEDDMMEDISIRYAKRDSKAAHGMAHKAARKGARNA
jgi:hypothetical protein